MSPSENIEAGYATTTGRASAAILASGIGCAALGIIIPLVEASPAIKSLLTLNKGVGPLSGKTIFAVVVWLIAWALLHVMWKDKNVSVDKIFIPTMILVIIGFLGTFPPVFLLFSPGH